MKKLILLLLLVSTVMLDASPQDITPLRNTDQCPGVNITFTVTLQGGC